MCANTNNRNNVFCKTTFQILEPYMYSIAFNKAFNSSLHRCIYS